MISSEAGEEERPPRASAQAATSPPKGTEFNALSSIKGRLAKGSAWISAARGLTNLLSALSTIVLARFLAPADFGLVALATSMLAVLSAFTDVSLSQALIRTRDPTREHYNTAWTLGFVRGILLAAGFAACGPLAASAYSEPRLELVMYALSLSAAFGGLGNPKLIMLHKELKFHQSFVLGVSSTLINVAVSIGAAIMFKSYWALIVGQLAGQAANVVISYLLFPFQPRFGRRHFRELWGFSIWVSLGQIVSTLNYRFDQLLVGSFLGRLQLGLYNVGSRLAIMPGQEMVRPLTATLFPAFTLVADEPERLKRAYTRVQALVTAIALPASLGFALIADPVVRLALGEKWIDAIPIVQLIAALYSLDTLGSLVAPLGLAKGQSRLLFVRNVQKLAVRAPLLVIGLYWGGLMGLLYGRMIAGVIGVVVDMAMVRAITQITILDQFKANTRCFIAVAAMMAAGFGLQTVLPHDQSGMAATLALLAGVIATAVIVYVATSWVLWRAAGRPSGPESEVMAAAGALIRRLRPPRATGGT